MDFTVDVCFDTEWLEEALKSSKAGKNVRVAVVIKDAGPKTTYKAIAIGGGKYDIAAIAGDFTKEKVWRGEE